MNRNQCLFKTGHTRHPAPPSSPMGGEGPLRAPPRDNGVPADEGEVRVGDRRVAVVPAGGGGPPLQRTTLGFTP
jgi:hypothetical protein